MQGVDLYQTAIHAIFKRMDEIAAQCGDRFPLFRPDVATQWKLSRRGSWLGGFWAGLWWRRAAYTRSADDHAVARTWSAQLQPLLSEPSINRSFVFWYGAAIGHQVSAKDQAAQQLAGHAALAISASFDPVLGCWTSGPGMGAGEPGTRTLNVDALAPTLALLHAYGGPKGRVQAHQHLQTCLRYLATEHGAWRENVVQDVDDDMQQEEAGTWPRGLIAYDTDAIETLRTGDGQCRKIIAGSYLKRILPCADGIIIPGAGLKTFQLYFMFRNKQGVLGRLVQPVLSGAVMDDTSYQGIGPPADNDTIGGGYL